MGYPCGPDVMNHKGSQKMGRKFQSQGRKCGDRRTVREREKERDLKMLRLALKMEEAVRSHNKTHPCLYPP